MDAGIDAFQEGLDTLGAKSVKMATDLATAGIKTITEYMDSKGFSSEEIKEYVRLLEQASKDGTPVMNETYDANFTRFSNEVVLEQKKYKELAGQLQTNSTNLNDLITEFRNEICTTSPFSN